MAVPSSPRLPVPPEPPEPKPASHLSVTADLKSIVYGDRSLEVAHALIRSDAYQLNLSLPKDDWYRWKSGIRAPCYCNCRTLLGDAAAREVVEVAMAEAARRFFPNAGSIIGVAHAGIPWGSVLAGKLGLSSGYMRAEAKSHGIGGRLQGNPRTDVSAIVIDDLVGSGGSIRDALDVLRSDTGIEVAGVLSIVNWGFSSMKEKLANERVRALVSYPEILAVALSQELIDTDGYEQLMEFYQDPRGYDWQ